LLAAFPQGVRPAAQIRMGWACRLRSTVAIANGKGVFVDRRRIALQIRAVRVTFRIEQPRRSAETMAAFRSRARALLDGLDEEARPYPELERDLADARAEVDAKEPTA
jgi:hypothetical protein